MLAIIALSPDAGAASLSISIGDEGGLAGSTTMVPVMAGGANGLGGLDFILAYDPDVLSVVNVSAGALNKGIIEANASMPGLLAVSTADPDGMNGTGDVAVIIFHVIGAPGGASDLVLSNVQAFDAATLEEVPVTTTNGSFNVSPPASTSPAASGSEAFIAALTAFGLAAGMCTARGRFR